MPQHKRKSEPSKGPHNSKSTKTILYHDERPVASIEPTATGMALIRKGIKNNAWLPLNGKPHISFQRDHLLQAFDDLVTEVHLIASDGESWRASLEDYLAEGTEFNHPTRGGQIAYPRELFSHENPNQGRLFL